MRLHIKRFRADKAKDVPRRSPHSPLKCGGNVVVEINKHTYQVLERVKNTVKVCISNLTMFKKEFVGIDSHLWSCLTNYKHRISAGAKSKVKSSVQRAIRSKVVETYPLLAPYIDEIIPKKSQLDLLKL